MWTHLILAKNLGGKYFYHSHIRKRKLKQNLKQKGLKEQVAEPRYNAQPPGSRAWTRDHFFLKPTMDPQEYLHLVLTNIFSPSSFQELYCRGIIFYIWYMRKQKLKEVIETCQKSQDHKHNSNKTLSDSRIYIPTHCPVLCAASNRWRKPFRAWCTSCVMMHKTFTRSQNFRAERDHLVQPPYFTGEELKSRERESRNTTTSLEVSIIFT